MNILDLNGSPRRNGNVASLLKMVTEGISDQHQVEWINIYYLKMKPCMACMKCRPDQECNYRQARKTRDENKTGNFLKTGQKSENCRQ